MATTRVVVVSIVEFPSLIVLRMIVPMLMVVVAMRGTVKALCGTYGVGLTQVMLVVVSKVAVAYYSSLTKRKVLPILSSPKEE